MKTNVLKGALFAIALACMSFTSTPTDPPTAQSFKLTFVDHLKAGMIEQDIFVEKVKGSGQVYRILPNEREKYLDYPVYATKDAQKHDPFFEENAGPFAKGASMDMTLRDWLTAKGEATCSCEEGWGVYDASFSGLIPNATYTMWHFFMAKPPTYPFPGTLDVPLGNRDGTQSVFITDDQGNGQMQVRFENCLQLTDSQLMSGVAIALHSDGKTYGFSPGPFGLYTHVQLFAVLPAAEDLRS